MQIFKYWARASAPVGTNQHPWDVTCLAGSNESQDHAHRSAQQRAQAAAEALRRNEMLGPYAYADRPLREELVEEVYARGTLAGVITRNTYGSLVLNAPRVLFADVDAQPAGCNPLGLLAGVFGGASANGQDDVLRRVRRLVDEAPSLGIRVYRTAAGFRCLVTSRTYEPNTPDARELLQRLQADPLYVQLCAVQECFRARLTAKPWRCGQPVPPSRFPWSTAEAEAHFRRWEAEYTTKAGDYAACELIESLGNPSTHPEAEAIAETHDKLACAPRRTLA